MKATDSLPAFASVGNFQGGFGRNKFIPSKGPESLTEAEELIEALQFAMDFITGTQDTSTDPQQSAHQSVRPCET